MLLVDRLVRSRVVVSPVCCAEHLRCFKGHLYNVLVAMPLSAGSYVPVEYKYVHHCPLSVEQYYCNADLFVLYVFLFLIKSVPHIF